jgi:transcriptional regulator with XRE-family HTH domain
MNNPEVTKKLLRERLAKNVRELRTKLGLTLKKASERAEIHWRYWQKIEAAEVDMTIPTLVWIADALSIDPGDLLDA